MELMPVPSVVHRWAAATVTATTAASRWRPTQEPGTYCGAPQQTGPANYGAPAGYAPKSSLAAGLLGIFLGQLGIHNFYLGYTGKAIAQLLLTLIGGWFFGLGALAAWIWGLVEGIMILTGSINVDGHGCPIRRDS